MGAWWKHWKIKAARKGTGDPTLQTNVLGQMSSLTGTHQQTDCIWALPLSQRQSLWTIFYNTTQ